MKMKILAATTVVATFFAPLSVRADNNVLGGDVGLACEAILCLSSANRPSECAKSLRRYFSIKFKKPYKTIQLRKNFLNLCPTSSEPNMPQFIDALANGAGRCDAAELNRVMRQTYRERDCDDERCRWVTRSYVRNAKPSYCVAYFDHEWTTASDKTRFVGKEKQGGRWVDVK